MYFTRSIMALALFGTASVVQAFKFDTTDHVNARELVSDFAYGVLVAREFADIYTASPLVRRKCGWGFGKEKGQIGDCTKEQYKNECSSTCNFMSRAAGGRGAGGASLGCHLACMTMKTTGTKE
ncbi:hypothetical protein Hypma_008382 [Hypsizygus marmoreus]|uniref:Uncharacterized protein n=1 Tax=Hypsizygus marmoreus TaxID=39966 RepID=A0A369JQD3_HYPMA|nr:hypothetical protein Hypma_008382 [Hypsizygus marmoreus]